jgi:hypothetical protein
MTNVEFSKVYQEAVAAAEKAFHESKPTPMAVQSSGINEGFDWSKPYEVVSEGACGFAWVDVFIDGRSKAVKEMKQFGLRSNYYGGYNFWSSECAPSTRYSQSFERKEAACAAFAKVLRAYGYSAYADSRLD